MIGIMEEIFKQAEDGVIVQLIDPNIAVHRGSVGEVGYWLFLS